MTKRGGIIAFGVIAAVIVAGSVFYLSRDDTPIFMGTEHGSHIPSNPAAAMIPWRNSEEDMAAFFPGATVPSASQPKIIALSQHRQEIQQRLGPDISLDSNALYIFPVPGHGAVLLRRASGEYGAIEVVLAVDEKQKVVSVRIQRHREPPDIATAITSPTFLSAFRGKTAEDDFIIGKGLPAIPEVAKTSATAIARAVRALLIEYNAGARS